MNKKLNLQIYNTLYITKELIDTAQKDQNIDLCSDQYDVTVILPKNSNIGDYCFFEKTAFKYIENLEYCNSMKWSCFQNSGLCGNISIENLKDYDIAYYAFSGTNIESVILPNNCHIECAMFSRCSKLINVINLDKAVYINDRAFQYSKLCDEIHLDTLGDSSMGMDCFKDTQIKKAFIPKDVTFCGSDDYTISFSKNVEIIRI